MRWIHKIGLGMVFSMFMISCNQGHSGQGSSVQANVDSEGRDYYEFVAQGATNCDDLSYLYQGCQDAPYGIWGHGDEGKLGKAQDSCYAAVLARNEVLHCQL